VRRGIRQVLAFVGTNSLILVMPSFHQAANGPFSQEWQIPQDEAGVFPSDLDFA